MAVVKYNKNTDLVKGEERMIFIGSTPIAYVKSDDFKLSPETQDISSKMSGKYKSTFPNGLNWSMSVDAIVSNSAGHLSYDALMNLAASGKEYPFSVSKVTVVEGADGITVTKGDDLYKGKVTVGEVGKKSARGEFETCNATLNGSGALKNGAGQEIGSLEAIKALGLDIEYDEQNQSRDASPSGSGKIKKEDMTGL